MNKEADDKLVAELKGKGVQIDTVERKLFVEATQAGLRQVDQRRHRRLRQGIVQAAASKQPRGTGHGRVSQFGHRARFSSARKSS